MTRGHLPAAGGVEDYAAARDPLRCPTHPGELLRDVVFPATGLSAQSLARRLGISASRLRRILTEIRPVTASDAVRLGKLFGNDGGTWLQMQAAHDLWIAIQTVDTSAIECLPKK